MPSANGHGPKPERIALYLRVSSEEQVERESIGTQEEFLADYCKLYGLDVAGIYKDEAVSGTVPLLERPGGRRLIEDAKAGEFASAIVYKLDRIGRTLLVVVDAHDRLMEVGVAFRSATEPVDTSTPAGRLIFQMLASFAEFERSTIAERSRDGLHRAFRGGAQPGRIPYGYDLDEDGQFTVVAEEAAVVRKIIANIAAGATLYSEAQRLNAEGVPSPGRKYRSKAREPGGKWTHTTVRKIVARTAYSGTHQQRPDRARSTRDNRAGATAKSAGDAGREQALPQPADRPEIPASRAHPLWRVWIALRGPSCSLPRRKTLLLYL